MITLYLINQNIKAEISGDIIRWFMNCYFNDFIGGIVFIAYCNAVMGCYDKSLIKLKQIELLLFFAGVFWEYITPVFRKNTVSDAWDIVAYMAGGVVYWLLVVKLSKSENI